MCCDYIPDECMKKELEIVVNAMIVTVKAVFTVLWQLLLSPHGHRDTKMIVGFREHIASQQTHKHQSLVQEKLWQI